MRAVRITALKLRYALGGLGSVIVVFALSCAAFLAVGGVLKAAPAEEYAFGIVNLDEGGFGVRLIEGLNEHGSTKVFVYESAEQAQDRMNGGEVEGWALIPASYSESVLRGRRVNFEFETAAGSSSGQLGRELVNYEHMRLELIQETYDRCRDLFDTDEECREAVDAALKTAGESGGSDYRISLSGGEARTALNSSLFSAVYVKSAGIVAMFIAFCAASMLRFLSAPDSARVSGRLLLSKREADLGLITDFAAVFCVCIALIILGKLCLDGLEFFECLHLVIYSALISALCLLYAYSTALHGAIDAFVPFIVLISCLLGGCFFELGEISPAVRLLSFLTPQGLALWSIREGGLWPALPPLLLTALVFALARRRYRVRRF
ncbi:MAG: ABC transporter permease [Clostridia bacterium]|nr:ABC transporter permease [Clostridia bacterium]